MITLTETTLIAAPIDRCFDLARSIAVHLAGNSQGGEHALPTQDLSPSSGLLTLGDIVTWQSRNFLLHQRVTSQITAYDPPHYFKNTMLEGWLRSMQHEHHFRAVLSESSTSLTAMHDVFRFAAPIPLLGRAAETLVLRRRVHSILRHRNAVLKQIAESPNQVWQQYLTTATV